jgi:hypothetical protein
MGQQETPDEPVSEDQNRPSRKLPPTDLKPHTIRTTDPMWKGMQRAAGMMGTNVSGWAVTLFERELKELGVWDESMASKVSDGYTQRPLSRYNEQDPQEQ